MHIEKRIEFMNLRAKGESIGEIAKKIGLPYGTVWRWEELAKRGKLSLTRAKRASQLKVTKRDLNHIRIATKRDALNPRLMI